jgi:hypothetical protein
MGIGVVLVSLVLIPLASMSHGATGGDVPPEIEALCQTLGHLIIDQGSSEVLDVVKDDFAGNARPAGSGIDIGARECDGVGGAPVVVKFPAPVNLRREVHETIGRLAWDWPGSPEMLMAFLLYVRAPGQAFGDGEAPTAVVRRTDPLTLTIDCRTLPLPARGPWQAAMRAMSPTGEFSALSNTIEFSWSATTGCLDVQPGLPPMVVRPPPPTRPRLVSS